MNKETLEKANRLTKKIDNYEYLIKSCDCGEKHYMFIRLRGDRCETPLVSICEELHGQIIDLVQQRKEQLEKEFLSL